MNVFHNNIFKRKKHFLKFQNVIIQSPKHKKKGKP